MNLIRKLIGLDANRKQHHGDIDCDQSRRSDLHDCGIESAAMIVEQFETVLSRLDRIISLLHHHHNGPPTRIALALPILTDKDGKTMAIYQLPNDKIADIMILAVNDAGVLVPAPVGDIDSVVSSDPTNLGAAIGTMPATSPFAGKASLRVNALHKGPFSGLTATVTDSAGLTMVVADIEIVENLTPKALALDFIDAALTPQPVPPA